MMPEIIHETVVAGRPHQVVVALTTAEGLTAFYTDQVRAQPTAGSELWFGFISSTAAGGRRTASSARALSSGRKSSTGSTATSRPASPTPSSARTPERGPLPQADDVYVPTRPRDLRTRAVLPADRVDDRIQRVPGDGPEQSFPVTPADRRSRCRFTRPRTTR